MSTAFASLTLRATSRPLADARAVDVAVAELGGVFRFLRARVGNTADAEDLTQLVALKALPQVRSEYPVERIRAYLFAAARSVLASYWSTALRLPVEQLREDARRPAAQDARQPSRTRELDEVLARLRPDHRTLLELRYLRGYTSKEVAREMGKTVGAVKVMQVRALKAAASAAGAARTQPSGSNRAVKWRSAGASSTIR